MNYEKNDPDFYFQLTKLEDKSLFLLLRHDNFEPLDVQIEFSIPQISGFYIYSEEIALLNNGLGFDMDKNDDYFSSQIEPFACPEMKGQNCYAMMELKITAVKNSMKIIKFETIKIEISGNECLQSDIIVGRECWREYDSMLTYDFENNFTNMKNFISEN